jgi:hypothetical protein
MKPPIGQSYQIEICTSNLGATPAAPGDPVLKHCFLKITDDLGQPVRTLAFGPRGVSSEPYPNVASARCYRQVGRLDTEGVERAAKLFVECADRGYSWRENNCCSCAIEAIEQAFGVSVQPSLRWATELIAQSPNPFA